MRPITAAVLVLRRAFRIHRLAVEELRLSQQRFEFVALAKEIEVWLVLEEDPKTRSGYKIVFDEARRTYGLAAPGFPKDRYPVLCGFYGDFWTTFRGM